MIRKETLYYSLVTLFIIFSLIIIGKGFYIVNPGKAAIHQRLGSIISINKNAGFYLSIPIVDSITKVDTQILLQGTETTALSKDLQFVSIGVALNYRVSDIESLFKNIGTDFREKIIDPFAAESIKAVVAKYTAEDLIQLRHEAKDKVREDLKSRLEVHSIDLVEFNFVHVDFSPAFLHSVEDKQIAQQNALMAKNKTVQIQEEALQTRLRADSEAYSLQVKKNSVTKELIDLKKAETFIKAIDKWDGCLPKVISSSTPLLNMDL